jgi:hypothetical protein
MNVILSITFGVIAYELHKRKQHKFALCFDVLAVIFILISWR